MLGLKDRITAKWRRVEFSRLFDFSFSRGDYDLFDR